MRLIREDDGLPVSRKCALAGVSRTSLYYEPRPVDGRTLALQLVVDKLYMEFPYYGTRRVMLHRRRDGPAALRGAVDLEHGPGQPVHQRGVRAAAGEEQLPARILGAYNSHLHVVQLQPSDFDFEPSLRKEWDSIHSKLTEAGNSQEARVRQGLFGSDVFDGCSSSCRTPSPFVARLGAPHREGEELRLEGKGPHHIRRASLPSYFFGGLGLLIPAHTSVAQVHCW